jgi:hypothetical protein
LWVTQSKPSKGLISTIPAPVKCSPHALQGLSEESISTVGEVCFAKKSGIAKITHLVGKKKQKRELWVDHKVELGLSSKSPRKLYQSTDFSLFPALCSESLDMGPSHVHFK